MRLVALLALCLWLAVGCTRRASDSTTAPTTTTTTVSRPTVPGVGGDAEGITGDEFLPRYSHYVPGFSCVNADGVTIYGARETLEPTETDWIYRSTACDSAFVTVPAAEVSGGVVRLLGYRGLIFDGAHDPFAGLALAPNASREVWCRIPDTGDVVITAADGKLSANLVFRIPGDDNHRRFYGPIPVTRAAGNARAYSSTSAFDLRLDGSEGALSVSLDGKPFTAKATCLVAP